MPQKATVGTGDSHRIKMLAPGMSYRAQTAARQASDGLLIHAEPFADEPQGHLGHCPGPRGPGRQCFLDDAGIAFELLAAFAGRGEVGVDLCEQHLLGRP